MSEPRERPILLNDEMVRAILEGRKTQTRRVVESGARCPGEIMWVREPWRVWPDYDGIRPRDLSPEVEVQYVADAPLSPWASRLRPSMHMPRWASRISLRVTGVRVEHLQDISEADAVAEGFLAKNDFRLLWSDIYGPASWEANPLVQVITFVVQRKDS